MIDVFFELLELCCFCNIFSCSELYVYMLNSTHRVHSASTSQEGRSKFPNQHYQRNPQKSTFRGQVAPNHYLSRGNMYKQKLPYQLQIWYGEENICLIIDKRNISSNLQTQSLIVYNFMNFHKLDKFLKCLCHLVTMLLFLYRESFISLLDLFFNRH